MWTITAKEESDENARSNHGAAGRAGGQRLPTAADWLRTEICAESGQIA
jgi:hypothetical protein